MENLNNEHRKRLFEVVDRLTDENQRYFLGVLEALNFAQSIQEIPELRLMKTIHPGMKCAD
jgi:hypothetical protein